MIYKTSQPELIKFPLSYKKPKELFDFLTYDFSDRCDYVKIENVENIYNEKEGIYIAYIYYSITYDFEQLETVEDMFKKAIINYKGKVYDPIGERSLEEIFGVY